MGVVIKYQPRPNSPPCSRKKAIEMAKQVHAGSVFDQTHDEVGAVTDVLQWYTIVRFIQNSIVLLADERSNELKVFCSLCMQLFKDPYVSACGVSDSERSASNVRGGDCEARRRK